MSEIVVWAKEEAIQLERLIREISDGIHFFRTRKGEPYHFNETEERLRRQNGIWPF